MQVAEGAVDRCREARREWVRQRLRGVIDEARQSRMDPAEIETIFHEECTRATAEENGAARHGHGHGH